MESDFERRVRDSVVVVELLEIEGIHELADAPHLAEPTPTEPIDAELELEVVPPASDPGEDATFTGTNVDRAVRRAVVGPDQHGDRVRGRAVRDGQTAMSGHVVASELLTRPRSDPIGGIACDGVCRGGIARAVQRSRGASDTRRHRRGPGRPRSARSHGRILRGHQQHDSTRTYARRPYHHPALTATAP